MSDRLEEVAATLERFMQRRDRLLAARFLLLLCDEDSLDYPNLKVRLDAARTLFTASKYELAALITPPSDTPDDDQPK